MNDFRNLVDKQRAKQYRDEGWWGETTLTDVVRDHAQRIPKQVAFVAEGQVITWEEYDELSSELAAIFIASGLEEGDRLAVLLPDGYTVHVAYLASEKAGLTAVGIGARAGSREILHILSRSEAVGLLTLDEDTNVASVEEFKAIRKEVASLQKHIQVPAFLKSENLGKILVNGSEPTPDEIKSSSLKIDGRRLGPDDLFIINSTSGTTGLPKCVMHTQNRHFYIHKIATLMGELSSDDVVLSALPTPFGFGLWTAHFTPAILGAPTVIMEKFSADEALRLVEAEGVTVICCVSTQFIMMLNSPDLRLRDLTSLKVMFTGGEAVPFEKVRDFENISGASVVQFYGSNESGIATGTYMSDPPKIRLESGGRRLPGTELKLFKDGVDVTDSRRGQPGSRGPASCLGYLNDPEANSQLFTNDGFVLHADICTIDGDSALHVVGRLSDLIIRGGKNISAAVVEEAVLEHPDVALVAAVAVPDEIFGERVGVFVELISERNISLSDLVSFLGEYGLSKEYWPEYLFLKEELPKSSGGKIAKGVLKDEIAKLHSAGEISRS
jgi:acyl-CoA synthetase